MTQEHPGRNAGKPARTVRASFWLDPRFIIGLALIGASSFGVMTLVSAADDSVQVLAARAALTPGDRITLSDLVPTGMSGDTAGLYLSASDVPDDGVILTRHVGAG